MSIEMQVKMKSMEERIVQLEKNVTELMDKPASKPEDKKQPVKKQ